MVGIDKPILFCTDVDGTLANNRLGVSERTKKIIKKAAAFKKGEIFKFVLATGRTHIALTSFIEELGLVGKNSFIVSCNGAVVKETTNSNLLKAMYLKKEVVSNIIDLSKDTATNVTIFTKGFSYSTKDSKLKRTFENIVQNRTEYVESPKEEIDLEQVVKISIFCYKKADSSDLKSRILGSHNDNLELLQTWNGRVLEIMPKGADKLVGIKFLQNKLGIEDDQVVVVGDNVNDVNMLNHFENSYAVKNASEHALKAAKNVLDWRNKDDAIAELLLQLLN